VEEVMQKARERGELHTAADVREVIHKRHGTKEKLSKKGINLKEKS